MNDIVNYRALGKRIRVKRKFLHLSQDELSKSVNCSISFLGHIERGSRKASISTMLLLCRELSTEPTELLQDSITWGITPSPSIDPFDEMECLLKEIRNTYQNVSDEIDEE